MNDAASFDAIMQCNLLEVFCEALGAAIFVTDKLDQVTFASIRLLHFYPIRQTAIEPGSRARDLYGSLFDAGCRFGQTGKQGGRTRDEWIAERTAIAWKERVDTIEQAGPDRWVRIVSRRFSSGLGFVVMQDVSEQKKKENLLRAEQERVKLTEEILDTLPVPVAVKDRNLHFVAVNQKFAELAQLPADSILGRNSWDIVDAELAGRMEQSDWQLLSNGRAQTDQVTVKRSDGSELTVERHARRVGRPGNHFISMSIAQSVGHSATEKVTEAPPARPLAPAPVAATPLAPAALEEAKRSAGSRKVLYLVGTHYTGHGLTLGLAAHDVELCLIRDEQEFASFVPAASTAGVAIDFVLIDGDFSPSAFNIVANAGFDFRMLAPGSEDATALAEILRSLDAREQKHPRRASTATASPASQPLVASAPCGAIEPDDRLDVLAVEDNPVNRMALEQILESLELRFTTVTSGREAIAAAAIARPRLVLADLTLPDMDIDELAGALRRSNAALPIIGLMPADNEGNREKCAAAGLVDCIAKPLSPDALDIIIRGIASPIPRLSSSAAGRRHDDQITRIASEGPAEIRRFRKSILNGFASVSGSGISMQAGRSDMTGSIPETLPASQNELQAMAYTDPLTGLGNRYRLKDKLRQLIAERAADPAPFTVGIANLDGFKPINDLFGPSAGDQILCQVAHRLKACIPDGATVIRYEGDEFAFLLPLIFERRSAEKIGMMLKEVLSAPYDLGDRNVRLSASFGFAIHPFAGETYEDLIKSAETALYRSKRRGRGQITVYSTEIAEQMKRATQLEQALRNAIIANEVDVHFQPIVNLANDQVVGFEALARWIDKDLGFVSPSTFVPLAEERGFIDALSETLLRKAAEAALSWPKELFLSFNLSSAQLIDPSTTPNIVSIINRTGLDISRLELEITETAMMTDPDTAHRIISELRASGIRISLDDFGTGQSSLSRLRDFTFDKVKIDRAFVSRITTDSASEHIVKAIITMCEGLNLEVVAEGIEDFAEALKLKALGCGMGQGYFYGRPVDTEKTLAYLSEKYLDYEPVEASQSEDA